MAKTQTLALQVALPNSDSILSSYLSFSFFCSYFCYFFLVSLIAFLFSLAGGGGATPAPPWLRHWVTPNSVVGRCNMHARWQSRASLRRGVELETRTSISVSPWTSEISHLDRAAGAVTSCGRRGKVDGVASRI